MVIEINRIQKYFFNALIVSVASIVIHSISVSFNVFVSGKIGSEAMGLITLVSGIYSFAITLATSGINLAVVRLVSSALPYKEKTNCLDKNSHIRVRKIMLNALSYCLFFSFLATILLFLLSRAIGDYLLDDSRVILSLRVMSFTLVPIAISSMINGYFCAVRRVYKNVAVQFCEQGIKIATISALLVLIAPAGIEYACISIALGGLVAELSSMLINITLYFFDRLLHKKKQSDKEILCTVLSKNLSHVSKNERKSKSLWTKIKEFFKNNLKDEQGETIFSIAFPVAISAYVRSALSTIEHLAIPWGLKKSGLGASVALSSYDVLCGMVFPLIFFPSSVLGAFSSLLVPEISSSYEAKDFARIRYIVGRVFAFSLLFSLGVSGVFICFSNEIGSYFFGSLEAGKFIRMLSPLIPLMYLDGAVDAMLKGLGEQVYSMRVNIIDSLLSVALILILLPKMGINGYIVVIFITELLNTSLSIIKLLSKTEVKAKVFKWVIIPTASIVLSTIISKFIFNFEAFDWALTYQKSATVIKIAICCVFYIVFSSAFGAISKDEFALFKRIIKN